MRNLSRVTKIILIGFLLSVAYVFQLSLYSEVQHKEDFKKYVRQQPYFALSEEGIEGQEVIISEERVECYPPSILPSICFQIILTIPRENVEAAKVILENKEQDVDISWYTGAYESPLWFSKADEKDDDLSTEEASLFIYSYRRQIL